MSPLGRLGICVIGAAAGMSKGQSCQCTGGLISRKALIHVGGGKIMGGAVAESMGRTVNAGQDLERGGGDPEYFFIICCFLRTSSGESGRTCCSSRLERKRLCIKLREELGLSSLGDSPAQLEGGLSITF